MLPESGGTSETAPAASLCSGCRPHTTNAYRVPFGCAAARPAPQAPAGLHSSQKPCSPLLGCAHPSCCVSPGVQHPGKVHQLGSRPRNVSSRHSVKASALDAQPGPTFVAGVDHILRALEVRLPGVHQLSLPPRDQHDRAPVLQGSQEGLLADLPQPAPAAEVADDLQGIQVVLRGLRRALPCAGRVCGDQAAQHMGLARVTDAVHNWLLGTWSVLL